MYIIVTITWRICEKREMSMKMCDIKKRLDRLKDYVWLLATSAFVGAVFSGLYWIVVGPSMPLAIMGSSTISFFIPAMLIDTVIMSLPDDPDE